MGFLDFLKKKDKPVAPAVPPPPHGEPNLLLTYSPHSFTKGVEAELTVTVKNNGPGAASNVSVYVGPCIGKLDIRSDKEVVLGELMPGESKEARYRVLFGEAGHLKFSRDLAYYQGTMKSTVGVGESVEVLEGSTPAPPQPVGEPDLKLSFSPHDFSKGVESELTATVTNNGPGSASNVTVLMRPLVGKVEFHSDMQVVLGELKPAESKLARYRVLFSETGNVKLSRDLSYKYGTSSTDIGGGEDVVVLENEPSIINLPPEGKCNAAGDSEVTFRVKNMGSITAENLSIHVQGPVEFLDGSGGWGKVGNLARAQIGEAKFKMRFQGAGKVQLIVGTGYQFSGNFCGTANPLEVNVD